MRFIQFANFRIVEVQSDKASVNIQCAADGVVTKVHWEEGDTVKVGEALVDIDYSAFFVEKK